jgi:hypoxanthine phosphoribosyltransferase
MNKYIINNNKFLKLTENIQEKLGENTYDMYVCILNGGKYISDALGIYYSMNIKASHYIGKHENSQKSKYLNISIDQKLIDSLQYIKEHKTRILVIDDVLDSGDTAIAITSMLGSQNDITLCVAVEKEGHKYKGNVISGEKVSRNDWVIFDWE